MTCEYKYKYGAECGYDGGNRLCPLIPLAEKRTGKPGATCQGHLEAMLARGWELAHASVVATAVRVTARCAQCGGPATELFSSTVCENASCSEYRPPFNRANV